MVPSLIAWDSILTCLLMEIKFLEAMILKQKEGGSNWSVSYSIVNGSTGASGTLGDVSLLKDVPHITVFGHQQDA